MPAPIVKAEPLMLGFAPDDEPMTPGIMTDCTNVVPTANGVGVAPGWSDAPVVSLGSGDGPVLGLFSATTMRGTPVYVIAHRLKLRTANSNSFLSNTFAATTSVASNAGNNWSFAQFGLLTIAARRDAPLMSSSAGAFSDIAGSPQAAIVCAGENFVLAFNTRNAAGTAGDGDRWHCSAFQDASSWAPSLSTQATTGRLVSSGGEITAAMPIGIQVVAYKAHSAFLGTYVGTPAVWQWERIPGLLGCVGSRALCDIGGAHFVVGPDGFWLYDGSRAQPLGVDRVSRWFLRSLNRTQLSRTVCHYDRATSTVQVWFDGAPTLAGEAGLSMDLGECLTYNVQTGAWGRMTLAGVTAVARFQAPAPGQYPLSAETTTVAVGGYGGTVAVIKFADPSLTATPTPSFRTRAIGDDTQAIRVSDVRMTFASAPAPAPKGVPPDRGILAGYCGRSSASITNLTQSGVLEVGGKFCIRQNDRWHQFVVTLDGPGTQMPDVRAITVNGTRGGTR